MALDVDPWVFGLRLFFIEASLRGSALVLVMVASNSSREESTGRTPGRTHDDEEDVLLMVVSLTLCVCL